MEKEVRVGWTDERVELLKKMWTDGLSASQIASELGGVERGAVCGKIHRLGLSGRGKSAMPRTTRQNEKRIVDRIAGASEHKTDRGEWAEWEDVPMPESAFQRLVDEVEPATLRGPVLPLHLSPAFPKPEECGLTEQELFWLSQLYTGKIVRAA